MAARFVLSKSDHRDLPDLGLPEIALMGRSNVGKSSLLGCLLKRRNLVRTSRTPGRTQLLNLFVLDEKVAFVDLPGYGYAKLPKSQRAQIDQMIQSYLRGREKLRLALVIVDSRRLPMTEYDLNLIRWLLEHRIAFVVVATKVDQISKNRRQGRLVGIRKALQQLPQETGVEGEAAAPIDVVGFSSLENIGRDQLMARLWSKADV